MVVESLGKAITSSNVKLFFFLPVRNKVKLEPTVIFDAQSTDWIIFFSRLVPAAHHFYVLGIGCSRLPRRRSFVSSRNHSSPKIA